MAVLSSYDNDTRHCTVLEDKRINLMGRKIFVSYKYKDNDVRKLAEATPPTWPCDYVNYIQKHILSASDVYKGEQSDEDLSHLSDDSIWRHLKDKIYDSTVTILLISPNMKEPNRWERSQWIPWEVSYSLREIPRSDRTSHNNAILAVVLPDSSGSYDYYNVEKMFSIVRENIKNGYIHVTTWDLFVKYPQGCIQLAVDSRAKTPGYKIVKQV